MAGGFRDKVRLFFVEFRGMVRVGDRIRGVVKSWG